MSLRVRYEDDEDENEEDWEVGVTWFEIDVELREPTVLEMMILLAVFMRYAHGPLEFKRNLEDLFWFELPDEAFAYILWTEFRNWD